MASDSSPRRPARVQVDAAHPWPGLAAYDEAAAEFFHGRDGESAELLRLIKLAPLTALYGKSGLGKSSLLQAGLFPLLRAGHFLPIYLRLDFSDGAEEPPIQQITRRLREEIDRAGAECPQRAGEESPWEYLHREDVEIWSSDNFLLTPVLVFDQFEELFSHGGVDSERTRHCVDDLTDLFENRIPADLANDAAKPRRARLNLLSQRYRMVLSFREDYLADLKTLEPRVPSLLRNYLRLEAMTRERAIEVVERAGSAVVEPGVAPLIVDFVGGRAGRDGELASTATAIEPVLLSLFCYQLNLRRGSGTIDGTLVKAAGQDILDSFYREALTDEDVKGPPEVCLFVEDYLVQGERFRGSYPKVGALDAGLVTEKQLDALTNRHRLLRVVQYADTARIELIHDCLVPVVCKTRDERHVKKRQDELRQRQAELEREVQEKEAYNRRLIAWRRRLILALGLVLIAFGWAVYQRHNAKVSARRAMAYAAVGGSYQTMGRKPELSTLLGLQAMSLAQASDDAKALERAESVLRRILNQRMLLQSEFPDKVHAVAFSPDGHVIAVASGKRLKILDAQSGEEARLHPMEHRSEIRRMAFTADGTRLIAGDKAGDIRFWDPRTGDDTTPKPMRHGDAVSALALGPAGVLATGSMRDGKITVWDLATGDPIGLVPAGSDPRRWVSDLAFSLDGSLLAVGEINRGVTTVWRVTQSRSGQGGQEFHEAFSLPNWKPGSDGVANRDVRMLIDSVAFSPDGRLLATGDRYNAVNLWDAKTGAHLDSLLTHTDQVRSVAFSPDGTRLASASDDGAVNIWDVASGRAVLLLAGHTLPIEDLAFSPDGNRLATASQDKRVKVWNVATHGDAAYAIAFSPDGKRLATGSGDNTIKVWETGTRRLLATLVGHMDRVVSVSFSPDNRSLASAGYDKTMRIWDVESGTEVMPPRQYPAPRYGNDKFYRVVYSRDGRWLATAGANHLAVLWDATTGSPIFEGGHDGQVMAVAFSPDSKQLASVGTDRKLKIWKVPSGALLTDVEVTEKQSLLDVDFHPAGDRVVITLGTPKVLIMSTVSREIRVLSPTRGDAVVLKAKFTADGKYLLLIGPHADVEIRDVDGENTASPRWLTLHMAKVNDVAVTDGPDGKWIATASQDGTFHVSPFESEQLKRMGCSRVKRKDFKPAECDQFLGDLNCPQPPPCDPSPGWAGVLTSILSRK